jgi:alkanesulfonate monooxygenase SsuD/methylene tetrahydromethanopterin reductase-like flavin-dependent oxidoreductase (luciferase family)
MGFGGTKNPLVDFQVATSKLAASQRQEAANTEAGLLREQANIIADETEAEAIRRNREIEAFASEQTIRHLSGGVLMDGSPLAQVTRTLQLGADEVAAIRRSGAAQTKLTRMQADSTERQGLESVLSAKSDAFVARTQEEQKARANRAGTIGSILKVGGGIASTILRGW